jgi:hypothetical protein
MPPGPIRSPRRRLVKCTLSVYAFGWESYLRSGPSIMIEFLNFLAASVLAIAAVLIARNANDIARNANSIAGNANDISERTSKLEADKHLIEWGQRVLSCSSSLVALRILKKNEIDEADFVKKRRDYRATLFALKEEGQLFFRFNGKLDAPDAPAALKAVHVLTELTDGKNFKLPSEIYDSGGVKELRNNVRAFIKDIQSRVGNHWTQ